MRNSKGLTWLRKTLGAVYRILRQGLAQLPGGEWLLGWTDPLHLSLRLLREAVKKQSRYTRGRLLDLGSGEGPYQDLFPQVDDYLRLDISPDGKTDIQGDGMKLPFHENIFDSVLCNQVLEHVPEPAQLLAEVKRVLRPAGVLLLTAPQTWGLHREPQDFFRYTRYGLSYLAEKSGLEVLEIIPTCGLWATLAQRLADTIIFTYAKKSAHWVIEILSFLLAPVLMAGYGLDKIFGKQGDTLDYVMVARKPNGTKL